MIFKHYTQEQIDAWLDGNVSRLRGRLMSRHIARCPRCRELREACEAGRALLEEVRETAAAHGEFVRKMPATLVSAPSQSRRLP